MQNVIVGVEAWQTAVLYIRDATADTQILKACELVGKCPHDKVREDALGFLWLATSGLVALTGSENVAQGRKVPEWHLMKTLHEMACMPGLPMIQACLAADRKSPPDCLAYAHINSISPCDHITC